MLIGMSTTRGTEGRVLSVALLVASVLISRADAATPEPLLDQIRDEWLSRAARFPRVKVGMQATLFRPRGSLNDSRDFSGDGDIPPDDAHFDFTFLLAFEGGACRAERKGEDFNVSMGLRETRDLLIVSHKDGIRDLLRTSHPGKYPAQGIIAPESFDIQELQLRPIFWFFAPAEAIDWRRLSLKAAHATIDNQDCVVLADGGGKTYFLDRAHGYVPLKMVFDRAHGQRELSIQYDSRLAGAFAPSSWRLVATDGVSHSLFYETNVTVTSIDFPEVFPTDYFSLEFPPGTLVTNKMDPDVTRRYVVQSDGSMQLDREISHKARHSAISSVSRNYLTVAITGGVVLIFFVLVVRARLRRRPEKCV